jgi:type II secretory pathway pseudopilin PulG
MTLIEILVTGAMLAIFSTMIARAVVIAFHSQRSTEAKVHALRQGSMMLDHMRRELATTSSLFNPNPSANEPNFSPSIGNPLRLGRNISGGTVEVWYWHDPVKGEVRRWETGEPVGGRVVAENIKTLQIAHLADSNVLRITTNVSTIGKPLTLVGRTLSL